MVICSVKVDDRRLSAHRSEELVHAITKRRFASAWRSDDQLTPRSAETLDSGAVLVRIWASSINQFTWSVWQQATLIADQFLVSPAHMPRERKQRGHKHAEKRKLEKEQEEKKYLENQERENLFYDRPKNPFGLLTREDEKFFSEVAQEFKKNEWDDQDAKEAFVRNVFVEMRGKELKIATSYVGRFLEMLLARCSRSEIRRLMIVFKGHVLELARHRFGSYVLEKVVGHVGLWASTDVEGTVVKEEEETERLESIDQLFSEIVEVC